ncbi:MAG: tripartite tricarboxylate transporter substrate binding protein [Betaproteobacteria bacterium]
MRIARALLGLLAAMILVPAGAQLPDKPMRVIVPFTPGGTVDLIGRAVAAKLGENLGRPVVVDNRGGASGAIGTIAAIKSPPDGATLLVGSTTTISIRPQMNPPAGYDPAKDLVPLTLAAFVPHVLVVTPSLPVKSVNDLIAYARSTQKPVSMANGGIGSPHYLAGEIFGAATGVPLTHISYKGGGEVLNDVMAGHVQFASVELSVASPLMTRGQLRAIGLSSSRRDTGWPDLPTVAEQGVPGYETTSWYGFFTNAGTPPDTIARMTTEVARALNDPVVKERLTRVGLTVAPGTQAEFNAFIGRENLKWGKVVRDTGVSLRE